MNEACQVWIEQRIEEELADQTDNGKSIVRIATELQAEIEKVFQAKLSITCLRSKVSRKRCANAQQPETPATTPVQAGDSGDKMTPQKVVKSVDALVKKGKSVRDATKEVATVWRSASAFLALVSSCVLSPSPNPMRHHLAPPQGPLSANPVASTSSPPPPKRFLGILGSSSNPPSCRAYSSSNKSFALTPSEAAMVARGRFAHMIAPIKHEHAVWSICF